jgi:chemotaxis protein CheX
MNIDNNLGFLYCDVLTEVITTISGFSLEVMSRQTDYNLNEMVGVMSLNGKKSGMLFISASESTLRTLCSYMIGAEENEITDDDIKDALCELVNIVAGSAKVRLSNTDYMFNLTAPFVIKGTDMNLCMKQKTRFVSCILGNEEISVQLKILY